MKTTETDMDEASKLIITLYYGVMIRIRVEMRLIIEDPSLNGVKMAGN